MKNLLPFKHDGSSFREHIKTNNMKKYIIQTEEPEVVIEMFKNLNLELNKMREIRKDALNKIRKSQLRTIIAIGIVILCEILQIIMAIIRH